MYVSSIYIISMTNNTVLYFSCMFHWNVLKCEWVNEKEKKERKKKEEERKGVRKGGRKEGRRVKSREKHSEEETEITETKKEGGRKEEI